MSNQYIEQNKILKKEFMERPRKWRIEAVIHDGSWNTVDKWAKQAKVKEEEIENWVEENRGILITGQESYRVGYEEVVRWYEAEGLDITKSLVPSNFPPKIWGGMTEAEVFERVPRRRVGTVSFRVVDSEILNKCVKILKGVARVVPDKEGLEGRYKAHGLSTDYMRNILCKGLTEQEFNSLDLKCRSVLRQRELIDLPEQWLCSMLDFYANKFVPSILKSKMPTISVYLRDEEEVHSQIVIWVIRAIQKFDEQACVPFSGYLSAVLNHWPNDLQEERVGKRLAKFQRDKKKVEEMLEEHHIEQTSEVIAESLNLDLEEYNKLNDEHANWLAEKNATTLTWTDSSNEKKGDLIGSRSVEIDIQALSRMSISLVKAAVDTEDWESADILIKQLNDMDYKSDIKSKLGVEFLVAFASHFENEEC